MQQNPAAAFEVGCETKHVEQGPRMTMIGVDKGEAEFAGRRDLADEIGFAAGVDADSGDEIWNQVGYFETDRAGLVDAAMGMGIDGLDGYPVPVWGQAGSMLTIDGSGDDRGGEAGERADLDNAPGRENADERGEKKIIP